MCRGYKDNSNLENMRSVKRVTPANFPPPKPPGKQPSTSKGLTIQVNITETDKFKELAELISNMLKDKRIDEEIRQEYLGSFEKIIKRMNDV